jgi:hypothetical protein
VIRYSFDGRYVTEHPELWKESDCEICVTQYPHPDIKSGLHANGPPLIFIRTIGGEWRYSHKRSLVATIATWMATGVQEFEILQGEEVK